MTSKWQLFREYVYTSSLDISKPNTGQADMLEDWQRVTNNPICRVTVNGIPLSDPKYAEIHNGFKEEKDLDTFLKNIILVHVKDKNTEPMVEYLKKTFHQGGLMLPISSTIDNAMNEATTTHKDRDGQEYEVIERYAMIDQLAKTSFINIQTTKNGFTIEETCTLNQMKALSKTAKISQNEEGFLVPESAAHNYVIEAKGKLNVDFSKDISTPEIAIESNSIKFNNSGLKRQMDKRSFGERILDFLKNILGVKNVVEQSPLVIVPKEDWKFNI